MYKELELFKTPHTMQIIRVVRGLAVHYMFTTTRWSSSNKKDVKFRVAINIAIVMFHLRIFGLAISL